MTFDYDWLHLLDISYFYFNSVYMTFGISFSYGYLRTVRDLFDCLFIWSLIIF